MDTRVITTIHGRHISTHKKIGLDYKPLPDTTLNQKFGIADKEVPFPGEYPFMVYLTLGTGGAEVSQSTGACTYPTQLVHSPEDCALFKHTPFIVRPLSDDLSIEEKRGYRMRVPFTGTDGKPYVAYYVKVIDMSKVKPVVELRHIENGNITSTEYIPNEKNLSPVPRPPSNVDKNNPKGDYLVSTAMVIITLGVKDLDELRKANKLMGSTCPGLAISEIGLVSGVDRQITANVGGVQNSYTEVIAAQMDTFVYKYNVVDETSTVMEIALDVGSGEFLWVNGK